MTVQCIACRHFDLRKAEGLDSQGYGNCAFERRSTFESATFPRYCAQFRATDTDIEQRRRQWLAAKQEKFNQAIEGTNGS